MFSKKLRELDRNTVQLMIDEMQHDIEKKDETITVLENEVKELKKQLKQLTSK